MRRALLAVILMAGMGGGTAQAADGGLSQQQANGKALFEARCAVCHQLPEPDMLKPKQWKHLLLLMQKRMRQADMPPLDDEEFAQVYDYLSSQSQ